MVNWPGLTYQQFGAKTMRRRFEGVTLASALQEFRSTDWWGSADQCNKDQKTLAVEAGIARFIEISVESGEVTSWLKGTISTDQRSRVASAGPFPITQWILGPDLENHRIFLDTGGAAATFEVEVQFDLPVSIPGGEVV